MSREGFIEAYAAALASQDWEQVAPLIRADACVTFSDGAVHRGIDAIGTAYRRNFTLIRNEQYAISDVHWISVTEDVAVYIFAFSWKGVINGKEASGLGRGTAVIACEEGRWRMVAEHLGKGA